MRKSTVVCKESSGVMRKFDEQLGDLHPFAGSLAAKSTRRTLKANARKSFEHRSNVAKPADQQEMTIRGARYLSRRGRNGDVSRVSSSPFSFPLTSSFPISSSSSASPAERIVAAYSHKINVDDIKRHHARLLERALLCHMHWDSARNNSKTWNSLRVTHGRRFDFQKIEGEMENIFDNKQLRVVVDDEALLRARQRLLHGKSKLCMYDQHGNLHSNKSSETHCEKISDRRLQSDEVAVTPNVTDYSCPPLSLSLEEADGGLFIRSDELVHVDDEEFINYPSLPLPLADSGTSYHTLSHTTSFAGALAREEGRDRKPFRVESGRNEYIPDSLVTNGALTQLNSTSCGDDRHCVGVLEPESAFVPLNCGRSNTSKCSKNDDNDDGDGSSFARLLSIQYEAALECLFGAARVVDTATLERREYHDLAATIAFSVATADATKIANAFENALRKSPTAKKNNGKRNKELDKAINGRLERAHIPSMGEAVPESKEHTLSQDVADFTARTSSAAASQLKKISGKATLRLAKKEGKRGKGTRESQKSASATQEEENVMQRSSIDGLKRREDEHRDAIVDAALLSPLLSLPLALPHAFTNEQPISLESFVNPLLVAAVKEREKSRRKECEKNFKRLRRALKTATHGEIAHILSSKLSEEDLKSISEKLKARR